MSDRVLIVEDDAAIRELMAMHLAHAGCEVELACDASSAVERLASVPYQLVLLDLGLPDFDGVTVCRRVRHDTINREVPVLAVSARHLESDIVLALESGADAFMVKPFSVDELLWRVRTLLRRGRASIPVDTGTVPVVRVRHLAIDAARRVVTIGDVPVALTRREFELLAHLARHTGRVLSTRALATRGWGAETEVTARAVHITVSRLRRKIDSDTSHPPLLRTVRGQGYSLA